MSISTVFRTVGIYMHIYKKKNYLITKSIDESPTCVYYFLLTTCLFSSIHRFVKRVGRIVYGDYDVDRCIQNRKRLFAGRRPR